MKANAPQVATERACPPRCTTGPCRTLLDEVLPGVSRSFYLTLRVLPGAIRAQVGAAYLLARAADTVADTKIIPRQKRLAMLLQLRKQLEGLPSSSEIAEIQALLAPHQSSPAEKNLLENLDRCFALYQAFPDADRALIAEVVTMLTRGMEFDLNRFPGESADQLAALESPDELDQYTYSVAGCVGPFWTKMCMAHLPELEGWNSATMEELGIRFGKGLQLCNVLRDIPKDLRIGRCYLPAAELASVGLKPSELMGPASSERLRPLYDRYLDLARAHLQAGWQYTLAVPASLPRLRLACAWPILIGLKTIGRLRHNPDILNPERRIKITRNEVYAIVARTFLIQRSDARLNRYHERLVEETNGDQ